MINFICRKTEVHKMEKREVNIYTCRTCIKKDLMLYLQLSSHKQIHNHTHRIKFWTTTISLYISTIYRISKFCESIDFFCHPNICFYTAFIKNIFLLRNSMTSGKVELRSPETYLFTLTQGLKRLVGQTSPVKG